MSKSKPIWKSWISWLIFLSIFWLILSIVVGRKGSGNENQKADGFTIEEFALDMVVGKDNKIEVVECITVNWEETGHHGIYRMIPEWLKYTNKEGKTVKRKAEVSFLRAMGDDYSLSEKNGKQIIRIGSEDKLVDLGKKTYRIKYTYDMGTDPFAGYDEFIFHAFGDYWGTPIKNAIVRIKMPTSVEDYNINVFTDKYRENNITDNIICSVLEDTITIFVMGSLEKALTIDVELPNNYFSEAHSVYGHKSLMIIGIVVLITVITIINWLFFGKDYAKQLVNREYYPPDNLSAAEIGYIYNNQYNNKQVIATIVQLASKGVLKMEKTTRDIKITNLLKKNDVDTYGELSSIEKMTYQRLFEKHDEFYLQDHDTFYKFFSEAESYLINNIGKRVNDSIASKLKGFTAFLVIVAMVLSFVNYNAVEDLNPKFGFLYYVSYACVFVIIFFGMYMDRKTRYGEMITAKVEGFRRFLMEAERQQLLDILDNDKNYHGALVPYAYVLGVSRAWNEHFDSIEFSSEGYEYYDYYEDGYIDGIYNCVYFPPVSSSSSGGSSGCSSCGGGCSSCGGGGSW